MTNLITGTAVTYTTNQNATEISFDDFEVMFKILALVTRNAKVINFSVESRGSEYALFIDNSSMSVFKTFLAMKFSDYNIEFSDSVESESGESSFKTITMTAKA